MKAKLKWKTTNSSYEKHWVSKFFKIELVEGFGGDNDGDVYFLYKGIRQIDYFKKLSSAKKVAQLIHEG